MPETSNKADDYKPGGRLDPEAADIDEGERERRRQERDRVQREADQG